MDDSVSVAARRSTVWPLALVVGALLFFTLVYFLRAPLPFFGYFSDPEVAYILSALQLNERGYVQMTDHPGTFLQIVGALLARTTGFQSNQAFEVPVYDQFRFVWLVCTVALTSLSLCMIWRQARGVGYLFAGAVLLLFHDYNTWTHFARFTPEGGFIALYLLVMVFACRSTLRGQVLTWLDAIAWGLLIGAVTTIKVTLWPVAAFLLGAFLCFRTDFTGSKPLLRWGLLVVCALLSYGVVGSLFADDPAAQSKWFLSLLTESGRYGHDSSEGSFLPIAQILDFTLRGFSFQSYTTIVPIVALSLFALWDCIKSDRTQMRLLSAGFLACLGLSFLIFAKHPYQIKYLLPQTYLFVAYFLMRGGYTQANVATTVLRSFSLIMLLVVVNAGVNFHILHRYNAQRYVEIRTQVDRLMQTVKPEQLYFSLEVPSSYTTYGLGVREITDFEPLYASDHRPLTVFRERSQNYQIQVGAELPLAEIEAHALIFTKRFFQDARVQLIWYDEALGLFAYSSL